MVGLSSPKNMEDKKHGDPRLSAPGKPCFHTKRLPRHVFAKTGLTQALVSSTLVTPTAAATYAYYTYLRRQRGTPDDMTSPRRRRPLRSVAKELVTGRIPGNIFEALSARLRLTSPDGNLLSTNLRKGGGIHAF